MGPRLFSVYLIEIMSVSGVHSATSSAFNNAPSWNAYPADKVNEIVDWVGSLLESDQGSRCRAETQVESTGAEHVGWV